MREPILGESGDREGVCMPGITGIIGKGIATVLRSDLQTMINGMMHEPFYKTGSYVNEELGVYAGWVCHPGSYVDCMPAMNRTKDVVLLFAGEHFPEYVDRDDRTAAELLSLYEARGEAFLRALNGWFAGVLIDLRMGKVLLFNDRYGMHRIYYHQGETGLLFSSEAKSLLKVVPKLRRLDSQGVGELIACNCVLENRTIFPDVSLLPGGTVWEWDKACNMTKTRYFSPEEWEGLDPLDEVTFYDALKETVKTVIPRYFREPGHIGMSLTGGLDSRLIMACLNPSPGELSCYTFGGKRDMLDISIARQVATACGQTHSVLRFDPTFFREFPQLAEKTIYTSDGTLDISSTHDMFFNRLARSIAQVRVTGKFGSEVIRDHSMFYAEAYQGGLFVPEFKAHLNQAIDRLNQVKAGHPLSVAVFKDFPWREYNKIIIEQSQSVFRSPYMDNDLVSLMYRAPAGMRATNQPQRRIIRECNPRLSAIISDRGYGEQTNPFVSKLLELYYYSLFKADYIYLFSLPHWLTRLDSWCLSLNGGKPLIGASQKFEYYRIWYHREVSSFVKDVLLDPRTMTRPYFDRKYLEMVVRTHTDGTRNYTGEITKAMSLELTQRLLIDA